MSLRSLKANRTRYKNILEKELAIGNNLLAEDKERVSLKDFVLKADECIKRLTDFCDKLEVTNEKISLAVAGTDSEDEIEELLTEDGSFMTLIIDCRDHLTTFQKSLLDEKTPSENASAITITEERYTRMEQLQVQMQQLLIDHQTMLIQQTQRQQNSNGTIKLPRLDIPSFNGDKMKWAEFWDTFETTIDLNDSLSDMDKLKYLNSKLTGEAKQAVSGIRLSKENYEVAKGLLKERFGDQQTVINSHYAELMNLTSASNNTKSLRSLYDQIEKNLRSLEALKQNIDQDIFISIITSKIPRDLLIQLEIQKGSKVKWSVHKLRELLNEYISARERAEQQNMNENKCASVKSPRFTTEALVSGPKIQGSVNASQLRPIPPCLYCNERHWSDECQVYRTLEARTQRVKGCCLICLKQTHKTNECSLSRTCYFCGQRNVHHRSLCPKKFGSVQQVPAHLADELLERDAEDATENVLMSSEEMVLMQTARANVLNPTTGVQENVRMLFDSGSQRTYITANLARKLNLELGKKSKISLVTFGSEKSQPLDTPSTVLNMELKDGNVFKITANVIPNITGSMQRRPFSTSCLKNWEYLWKDNALADTLPTELETSTIDLLIGNDYYLDFILPQKVEIQPGMYMLGSKLGWILAGRTSEYLQATKEHNLLAITCGTAVERQTNVFTWMDEALSIRKIKKKTKSRKRSKSKKRSKSRKKSKSWKRSKSRKRYKSRKRSKSFKRKKDRIQLKSKKRSKSKILFKSKTQSKYKKRSKTRKRYKSRKRSKSKKRSKSPQKRNRSTIINKQDDQDSKLSFRLFKDKKHQIQKNKLCGGNVTESP